jgi:hypothetical protein
MYACSFVRDRCFLSPLQSIPARRLTPGATSRPQSRTEVVSVNPAELAAALERPKWQSLAGGDPPRTFGQQVGFDGPGRTYLKSAGLFTVTKLLLPLGVELRYRIKSETEAQERVAVGFRGSIART